jgi:hypothetical protein
MRTPALTALALLCAQVAVAQTASTTPSPVPAAAAFDLYRGTSIVTRSHRTHEACVDAARADTLTRAANGRYSCRSRVNFTTTFTAAPPPTVGQADLSWSAVSDPRVIAYRVYWGTAPGVYSQPYGQGVLVTSTTHRVADLPGGRTYYFAVTAVGEGIESGYSSEASKAIP